VKFNIVPLFYCTKDNVKPKFLDVLKLAREKALDGWMGWCNCDCEVFRDPREVLKEKIAYSFRRIDVPSNKLVIGGYDMFLIHIDVWDKYFIKDFPDMFLGSTHIDHVLVQMAEKYNVYMGINEAYIKHIEHKGTDDSSGGQGRNNPIYMHNLGEYLSWISRNNLPRR